jgi:PIN domain nuclease of toxin-antitoxin system
MKYLLDTHTFLWYFEDSDKLSELAVAVIEDARSKKYASVASLWEFSIKYSMNKLQFHGGLNALLEMLIADGFIILPILRQHLDCLAGLPFLHRDPFDRLLISIVIKENLTFLTADKNIHLYDVKWVW